MIAGGKGGKMRDLNAHAADCDFFGEVIEEACKRV